jgi:hypothetical protein
MRAHSASASRIGLLEKCGWWATQDAPEHTESRSPAAAHGTLVHQLVHDLWSRRTVLADDSSAFKQAHKVLEWLLKNAPHTALSEVAMVYDVEGDSTVHLPDKGHRAYPDVTATQVPGTADVMWLDAAAERAVVLDIKTGYHVDPVDQSPQLETLALAASRLYGVEQAMVGYIRVNDTDVWGEWHALSALDLDARRNLLARRLSIIQDKPKPEAGAHCAWCPARTVCPKTTEMMVAAPKLSLKTAEDVAKVYPMLKPWQDLLDTVTDRCEAILKQAGGTIQVGDEDELRFVPTGGGEYVLLKLIPEEMQQTLRSLGAIKDKARGTRMALVKTGVRKKRTGT